MESWLRCLGAAAAAMACALPGQPLAAGRPTPSLAGLTVSFRLDPRLTRGLYMGDRWVAPATFNSLSAPAGTSIAVPARAQGFDAMGRRWKVSPGWEASDPEAVTISPPRGGEVTITVRRPGTSTVTLRSGQTTKRLTIVAEQRGESWQLEIRQEHAAPAPPPARDARPRAPVTTTKASQPRVVSPPSPGGAAPRRRRSRAR